MSKRKGDFRSKIDSILADDQADGGSPAGGTGPDRKSGAESDGNTSAAMSRHVAPTTETKLDEIEVALIRLPRGRRVDADKELNESITRTGILQPLLLRPTATGFEVLDGGRRLAVARDRGLRTVPAVVRTIGDVEARAMSAERKAVVGATAKPAARNAATTRPLAKPAARARKAAPGAAAPARRAVPTPSTAAGPGGRKAATSAARPVRGAAAAAPRLARTAAKAASARPATAKPAAARATPAKATRTKAPASRATMPKASTPTVASRKATVASAVPAVTAAAKPARPVKSGARKAPSRGGRAAAEILEVPAAPIAAPTPVAEADETVVMSRPRTTPSLTRLAIPEEPAVVEEPVAAEVVDQEADAPEETIIWRRRDEVPVERPAAASGPAPSFPRSNVDPTPAQVAAASFRGTNAAPSSGGTGKLLADWILLPLACGALAFSISNLAFFNNITLFVEAGAVCVLALVVFGVIYMAGRRA